MNAIDFLDAVGRVNQRYIAECITYKPPKKMNVWIKRMSAIAACFIVVIAAVLVVNHMNQPVIIDENGFHIENGVLLRYTGSETDVTIPEEVETIADFTFLENQNANKIEVVRLGSSVQTVEVNAFAGLENLVDIIIAANNFSFVEEDGLLMTSDRSILLRYERDGETSFTIPDTVRFVGAHAVQGTELEEIDFGENLEYIGYNAFASNRKLKAIYLPDSVKYISNGAFSLCISALDGYVPEGVEFGGEAFYGVPFYMTQQAGQMSPLEEINRGLITPSEAILKSDVVSLAKQLEYLYAVMRGEEYEAGEEALFGYAAVHDLPEVPEGLDVPETVDLTKLSYADRGWGQTGIYDIRIDIPAGDYTIMIESHAYGTDKALYWSDVRFRLENVYYTRNTTEDLPESDTVTGFGWTAVFGHVDGFYSGITYTHENGTIIRSFLHAPSDTPYVLTFSPNGTRVAVEYEYGGKACFYIQSLNDDKLMHDMYDYREYLNGYFGQYEAGTLTWADDDNIEGINKFGHFRWNIYEYKVTQLDDDPSLTDPNNHNMVNIYVPTFDYDVHMDIPEIWRERDAYYDLVRESQGLEGYRMTLSEGNMRPGLMTDGEWTPEKIDSGGWIYEDTVITCGTNNSGAEYIIFSHEIPDFHIEYRIAVAYNDLLLFDFTLTTYPEDGENAFEDIVLPLVESITVETTVPTCLSTKVDALPAAADEARITSKLIGGSPVIYVFDDDLHFYLAYLNADMSIATLSECTLSLPDGYTDGRIIDAGGRGGSGEFCIYISAKTDGQTVVLGYLFSGEGVPQPHEIIVDNEYTVYFDSADELLTWLYESGDAEAFPTYAYTITVTGFDTLVVFEMNSGAKPASITAYGQTMPITEDAWLYGNYTFDLFAAEGAVVFSWGYYNIGYTYIIGENFTQTLVPGSGSSIHLYADDSGNLRYQRINNRIADIIQTGGLSAATGYDDFLYCYGDASMENGRLVLGDVDEYYTIGDKYDLDLEFENMYSRYYDSIQDVFEEHKLYPGGTIYRPTVFEILLTMTVSDIRSTYGTLTLEYSEHGPGQPVYSMKYLPGVLLVFHDWDMDDPLTEDMMPSEVIVTEERGSMIHGIRVGSLIEDRTETIHWSDLWYHVINGTANLQAEFNDYTVTYTISGETLNLPAEDTASEFDWDAWEAEYIKNPTGRVIGIRIELNK